MIMNDLKKRNHMPNNVDTEIIMNELDVQNISCVILPDFEEALIGLAYQFGKATSAVYDFNRILELLMEDSDMTREEALEYFEYNIIGSHMSEDSDPVFVDFLGLDVDVP